MRILDLYITDICNLNCEYCYIDIVKKESESFKWEQFMERVDLLSFDSIKFLGWEPLVRWKEIQLIIDSISNKKPETTFSIITNGVLLDQNKILYILQQKNTEVLISLHEQGINKIKNKIESLLELGNQVSFYIIFDPKNFAVALWKFLEFSRYGFKNFCFAPEIYGDWNKAKLWELSRLLQILQKIITKYDINIWGVSKNSLKNMNYGCEKFIYDKRWQHKACNRSRALSQTDNFKYIDVYDYFQAAIWYKQDPNRWFYVCPVGWYLDNIDYTDKNISSYRDLNSIFLKFYRDTNKGKLNFLSEWLEEIRFNMTRQCNIRCEYCYVDFDNEKLPFIEAKNISDFFIEQTWTQKTFSFFGWEPLLEYKNLQKIVKYIEQKKDFHFKKVFYRVATNFMLVSQEIVDFFILYKFHVHISFNWVVSTNDKMRDNSSQLVLKNIDLYAEKIWYEKITILLAFSPDEIMKLYENITYIYSLWFKTINLELIFWEKYIWKRQYLQDIYKQIIKSYNSCSDLYILLPHDKDILLDIDVKWRCNDNSLEFYHNSIDLIFKKDFDTLLLQAEKYRGTKIVA